MPRTARSIVGGYVYHVLNRANGPTRLFTRQADFLAFDEILAEVFERVPLRILGYTVMANHWHFVVWPRKGQDDQVSDFFRRLSLTHSMRWHVQHKSLGSGHVYQGRFKSFPIEQDEHLLSVLRYVEQNALRAKLVKSADVWRWSSLYRRLHGTAEEKSLLAESPVRLPRNWLARVNKPQPMAELLAIRQSVIRGQPYGSEAWQQKTARKMGLESTFRPRGRPRKHPEA